MHIQKLKLVAVFFFAITTQENDNVSTTEILLKDPAYPVSVTLFY